MEGGGDEEKRQSMFVYLVSFYYFGCVVNVKVFQA